MNVVFGKMASQFSEDGKYFAQLTSEGKLKLWNTNSNSFEQEFTPNIQVTSSCTCLHFISTNSVNKVASPRKKKRRNSINESHIRIALGTSSGRLIIYSVTKGDLDFIIDSTTSQSINCLSNKDEFVYSGTDTNILIWNFYKRNTSSKWTTGNDKITAILNVPNSDKLLTASKCIKLWNITSKEVLKTYTGHSSQITLLYYFAPKNDTAYDYVISGSKGDRLLSCWNLSPESDGKNSVASFLMEDIVNHLSVYSSRDGPAYVAATVRSGVVHVYQHAFNGKKSNKPVKPLTTVQVVSDSKEKEQVSPMYITAAKFQSAEKLKLCYGTAVVQTFEDITISNYKKIHCLLRADVRNKTVSKDEQVSKLRTPIVSDNVHYLSSQTSGIPAKRKNDGLQELSMEKRLENLMVNDSDDAVKEVPKANNVAKLLIQGLHSHDKNILRTVLFKKDEALINNTIKRLPASLIVPLSQEITKLVQGKIFSRQIGLMWLKNLITIHSGLLLSNPDLPGIFGEILGSIEAGMALERPRHKLIGRLDLLVSQMNNVPTQEDEVDSVLVFNDKALNHSDDDDEMEFEDQSSENEWQEESSDEEGAKNVESGDSDVMSS